MFESFVFFLALAEIGLLAYVTLRVVGGIFPGMGALRIMQDSGHDRVFRGSMGSPRCKRRPDTWSASSVVVLLHFIVEVCG